MATLLLRISAPMQSWGTQSHLTTRDTGTEPSKSGIIGLICAALGRGREEPVNDLDALRMGVRLDRPGRMQRDFQIVQNVLNSDGVKTKASIITNRYYLADAVFLVGLEGEPELLRQIAAALTCPVWQLYFGRKAYVPAEPILLPEGLREDQTLDEALAAYPWLITPRRLEKDVKQLTVIMDDPEGEQKRNDVPVSFADRSFRPRWVRLDAVPRPAVCLKMEKEDTDDSLKTDSE